MAAFTVVALFCCLKKKKIARCFPCYFIVSSHQLCKGWVAIHPFTKEETEAWGDKRLLQTPQLIQDSEDVCFSAHLNTSRCPEDPLYRPLLSPTSFQTLPPWNSCLGEDDNKCSHFPASPTTADSSVSPVLGEHSSRHPQLCCTPQALYPPSSTAPPERPIL